MILVDTNILARTLQIGHVHQLPALDAMDLLRTQRNEVLVVSPQNLIELYAIGTRSANGLGFAPDRALEEIENIKRDSPLLPETPDLFPTWEQLVAKYKPVNRRVFDMRHAAFMVIHAIPSILTFNDSDFSSITEIQTLNPFTLLGVPRV